MCESFLESLECELLRKRSIPDARRSEDGDLRLPRGLVQSERRHSALGGVSPINYERIYYVAA
jgi:putative transposase